MAPWSAKGLACAKEGASIGTEVRAGPWRREDLSWAVLDGGVPQ